MTNYQIMYDVGTGHPGVFHFAAARIENDGRVWSAWAVDGRLVLTMPWWRVIKLEIMP